MPRLMKTVIPRIRKSLADRGVIASLFRSLLLPVHLFREHRIAKAGLRNQPPSDFDLRYGVETDGEVGDRTYLSDLEIPSPNWIYGRDYSGIVPEKFVAVMSSLDIRFEEFLFIDFGSGKGRALLLASEFPFKRIIGIEFSPQLHAIAQRNIQKYASPGKRCDAVESVCADFSDFELPPDPAVLFFFDPCYERVLAATIENIRKSRQEFPRPIYIVYVSPVCERVLDSAAFLVKLTENRKRWFSVYTFR